MKDYSFEKILFDRQYNEKLRFPDYNGLIKKMRCHKIISFQCTFPPFEELSYDVPVSTCKFSSKWKNITAVANENGIVCIQNVNRSKPLKYLETHKNTVYDIAWMPQSSHFVTVSGDNSAKLWNFTESDISLVSTFRGHKRSVRCVTFKPENTAVFATGSRDGSLMIWDVRASQKCAKFSHHLPDQIIPSGAGLAVLGSRKANISLEQLNSKSVTGLIFQNDYTLISCGSMDNIIRVWDMRKTYSRSTSNILAKYQMSSPHSGFSYLCMNSAATKLYANCMDSYIYCYNINSYDPDPVAAYCGHENGSFYIKSGISFDGLYLMSGSSDDSAYIWNTRNAELNEGATKPFVVLNSHSAEVTSVEISPDNMVIVTCSDDGTFRLWNSYIKTSGKERGSASIYNETNTSVVKTKWKNKRKLESIKMSGSIATDVEDDTPHAKICRFYSTNLFSSCICQKDFMRKKAEKRSNDELGNNQEVINKKASFPKNEVTSPKKEMTKETFVSSLVPLNFTPKKQINSVKIPFKRKLGDMLNFVDENQKNKKINCSGILSVNVANVNASNKLSGNEFKLNEGSNNADIEGEVKQKQFYSENKNSKDELKLGFKSPTCNLPNYVEDGTSPYIHKCPKISQKENDWLTKLKKNYQRNKTLSTQKLNLPLSTPSSREKRKKITSGEHTLHKYFKVSSKTTEKPYGSQELQRKTVKFD